MAPHVIIIWKQPFVQFLPLPRESNVSLMLLDALSKGKVAQSVGY